MRTLYLTRTHGRASLSGETVVVSQGDDIVERVPLPLLDQILVMGNIQITSPLIEKCLKRQVPIAFLSASGWCHGRLQPLNRTYRNLARQQANLSRGECLRAARHLIMGKIHNGRVLLLRLTRRQRRELVQPGLDRLERFQQQVARCLQEDSLRGLEGLAAGTYYQSLGALLEKEGFGFIGRHRRPPTTPLDAVSSFGYSVLWNAMYAQIELQGLDAYTGILHHGSDRHAALVSDLIEPLRTLLVDPFNSWRIRTRRVLVERDLFENSGEVRLTDEARKAWLQDWSRYMSVEVLHSNGAKGPRWAFLEFLVRSFVRFVFDPSSDLMIPERR